MIEKDTCVGLAAQIRRDARVLVLGSMPGRASLCESQYYAHPRNRFWPLMEALCAVEATLPYAERLQRLHALGIGLWDVIGRCQRRGSLDADIVRGSEVANAVGAQVAALPRLRLIGCNGGAAHVAFLRFIAPGLPARPDLQVIALPSTSPANAAWSLQRLTAAWQPVGAALR